MALFVGTLARFAWLQTVGRSKVGQEAQTRQAMLDHVFTAFWGKRAIE